MTIPKSRYDVIKKIQQRRYEEHHGVRDIRGKSAPEKAFEAKADANETPATNKGSQALVDLKSI